MNQPYSRNLSWILQYDHRKSESVTYADPWLKDYKVQMIKDTMYLLSRRYINICELKTCFSYLKTKWAKVGFPRLPSWDSTFFLNKTCTCYREDISIYVHYNNILSITSNEMCKSYFPKTASSLRLYFLPLAPIIVTSYGCSP